MPKFSEFFQINAPQAQLDFVDISTDYDTRVYVDPYAIEIQDDVWSGECSELIRVFFLEVLNAIRARDIHRARNLMSHLHEPAETFLGVSADEPLGKGVGSTQAMQLISAIRNSKAYKTGVLSDLSEMALFVENVGRDKISDLTTNIIRSKLVEYTNQQCELYGIQTETYNGPPMWDAIKGNWVSKFVNLPRINKIPVMLIPKYIVRKSLSLDSQEFYNKQITDFLVAEHLTANSSLVQVLKGKRRVFKKDVREKHPKSKSMIAETVANNPYLLEVYKDLAKDENRIMVNVNDNDISVAQACLDLSAYLKKIPTGTKDADKYHRIAMHILTICFYPGLIQPDISKNLWLLAH